MCIPSRIDLLSLEYNKGSKEGSWVAPNNLIQTKLDMQHGGNYPNGL